VIDLLSVLERLSEERCDIGGFPDLKGMIGIVYHAPLQTF
jgi:hypothetical protein